MLYNIVYFVYLFVHTKLATSVIILVIVTHLAVILNSMIEVFFRSIFTYMYITYRGSINIYISRPCSFTDIF